jgi:hypothetical protein
LRTALHPPKHEKPNGVVVDAILRDKDEKNATKAAFNQEKEEEEQKNEDNQKTEENRKKGIFGRWFT